MKRFERKPAHNTGLAKVAVQCSAETFVVKIATFAKPENVMGKFMKRQPNGKRQTREPPKNNFDSS